MSALEGTWLENLVDEYEHLLTKERELLERGGEAGVVSSQAIAVLALISQEVMRYHGDEFQAVYREVDERLTRAQESFGKFSAERRRNIQIAQLFLAERRKELN